ncbi:MAG TPA: Holliday junction branch migration protein RuvA [Woeseiaceae bacterium]
MIGSLRGKVLHKQAPQVVIECAGVGYEVEMPLPTFFELPPIGDEVFLFTHMVVREDAQNLYGFASEDERQLFRSLLRISGVGARMGLAILSAMSAGEFQRCVEQEDAAMLVKVPGVGKKTAERLIIEMRDRINRDALATRRTAPVSSTPDARSEAFNALLTLGYKATEVNRLLSQLDTKTLTAEDLIRQALKRAAK